MCVFSSFKLTIINTKAILDGLKQRTERAKNELDKYRRRRVLRADLGRTCCAVVGSMSADIRAAFDKASGAKTPWNPSRHAVARVKNPLPAPTCCPYCNGPVELVTNDCIYGRCYGDWPWAYLCANRECGAYVGLHPMTAIPLGTLADADLREWRKRAKAAFNPLWQGSDAQFNRSKAYAWLAGALGITEVGTCHIGWFDVGMCRRVIRACLSNPIEVAP